MIKAKIGADMAVIGLTRENIDRLVAGQGILVDLTQIELSGKIILTFGETTQDITHSLRESLDPDLPDLPDPQHADEVVKWSRP